MGKCKRAIQFNSNKNYGCHIITVTPDIIKKTKKFNYSLEQYSIDTVKQFYIDAKESKFKLI